MDTTVQPAGAVVDRRLAPAGLSRLLGNYGTRRAPVLGMAAVLFLVAAAAVLLIPAPVGVVGIAFILPVALAAAEIGMKAGLLCAACSVAAVLASPASGLLANGPAAVVPRSLALFFVAFVVGRLADRASKSRRLLEQVLEATTDSIYLKDLDGRYLLVNSAAARLIGQPGQQILGRTNRELLPDVADEVADHDQDVITRDTPSSYEITGRFGTQRPTLSVTKSPFRDASGATIGALGIARDITEQRRTQAESTRFFDLSGDMLCTVDFEGRLRRVNGEWRKTLGYDDDELIGRHVSELMNEEDHELMTQASRAVSAKGGHGANVTTCWLAKDGSWRWIDWTLRTILDEGMIYASGRDVTQRRTGERALAASESRYRALVHGLPGTAVILVDGDLRLEFASGRALATGRSAPGELIGEHVGAILPEPHGAALQRACAAALEGEPSGFDLVCSEHALAIWVRTSPLRDERDEIVGAMLIAQDVRERVERERAIGEAQERFRRAFEDAPIGMAVADLDGNYLDVNQALCAITGYPAGELCGMHFAAITHPDDLAGDHLEIRALLEGALSTSQAEKRYLRADGGVVWVTRTTTLVRDAAGLPLHFLDQVQDITERRRFEQDLRHLADHDPLTGLLNRRRFEQELDRQVKEVARYGPRGALLVLDLDHFKYVNDALGHHAGDALIVSVAETLRGRLRDSDILARLGGDEFAVLLPHADERAAQRVAGDLVHAIRGGDGTGTTERHRRVTTSVGVAPIRAGATTGAELLIAADLAMYHAKEGGRDRYAVVGHDGAQPDPIRTRVHWLERIRAALANDRFVLHAQPIRDLRTGKIAQHELLLRMLADDGSLIAPATFLPLAERFGLTPEIDGWVATRAIELLAADPDGKLALEVNLSGPSLNDTTLLALVEEGLASHQIDPRRLIFEITETAAVANIPLARRFAERLMALGCRFALDDFGSGFGSFYYLKHLPFDYLKIDGEFVAGCLSSRTDQLVIESVVRIAQGLGKETIAECVESADLEAFLRERGIDHAQGFHVGRPVPVLLPQWRERLVLTTGG
jgi:diguanylate cyclase (GGDEF)-like protein/PAS domain S-box-containing protein